MHISLKHAVMANLGWLTLAVVANAEVLQVGPTRKVASLAVASVVAKSGDTVEVGHLLKSRAAENHIFTTV